MSPMDYGHPLSGYSDLGSPISVVLRDGLGIPAIRFSIDRRSVALSDALAGLTVLDRDGRCILARDHLKQRGEPHGIVQSAETDGCAISGSLTFADPCTLVYAIRLRNKGRRPRVFRLGIRGKLNRESALLLRDPPPARPRDHSLVLRCRIARTYGQDPREFHFLDIRFRSSFTMDSRRCALGPAFVSFEDLAAGAGEFWLRPKDAVTSLTYDQHYAVLSKPVRLGPGKTRTFHYTVTVHDSATPKSPPRIRSAFEPLERNRRRWKAIAKTAHQHGLRGDDAQMYLHAAQVLIRNTHAPKGLLGTRTACYPAKAWYDAHWLWDACFHSFGLAKFDPKLAKDSLLILIESQKPDGRIPMFTTPGFHKPEATQAPLLAWAVWRLYEKTGDKALIQAAYPVVARFNRWWFRKRDADGDGLCEYVRQESGWDNSPRWDHGQVAAADLNAFLYAQMRFLACMADKLNRPTEAGRWRAKAEQHADRVVEALYSPRDNCFWDIRCKTRRFSRVLTPACFMPLWAGVPFPEAKARRMIERYLLSSNHFFSKIPFPVVAYSSEKYDAGNYWRGPVWFNIAYFMLGILDRYGYHNERDLSRDRLLKLIEQNHAFGEYFNTQTGVSGKAPEYGWTAAVAIQLLVNEYDAGPPQAPLP